jgi:hypothetical protein
VALKTVRSFLEKHHQVQTAEFWNLDPYHLDADPDLIYHPVANPDADPDSDFYLMRIRMRIRIPLLP